MNVYPIHSLHRTYPLCFSRKSFKDNSLSWKFSTFAFGLSKLSPRHIEKKEALCLSRSRERRKFKTIQREKRSGFSRYSVGCYYHTLNKGYSYDLRLRTWHLQFHASWFNKMAPRTAEFIKVSDEQIWIPQKHLYAGKCVIVSQCHNKINFIPIHKFLPMYRSLC